MQAATRPPMPGGMGIMPQQANGPTPVPGSMPLAPGVYVPQPPPTGYNNHQSHPGGMPYRYLSSDVATSS